MKDCKKCVFEEDNILRPYAEPCKSCLNEESNSWDGITEITLVASNKCGWEFAEECRFYLADGTCCCDDLCQNIILIEA